MSGEGPGGAPAGPAGAGPGAGAGPAGAGPAGAGGDAGPAGGAAAKTPGALVEGQLSGAGMRIAVVCSRFNRFITDSLLAGALDGLGRHGVDEASVTVAWVPGAFEIPLAAHRLATTGRYDAVITLGAVIRGATSHYDLVAGQCAAGVQRVQLDTGVPVIFGVLTTDTIDQAIERAGTKAGNKGFEAAASAIEMADLVRRLL